MGRIGVWRFRLLLLFLVCVLEYFQWLLLQQRNGQVVPRFGELEIGLQRQLVGVVEHLFGLAAGGEVARIPLPLPFASRNMRM